MYISQGRQSQRTKFWCQQKSLVTSVIVASLKTISLNLIYTIFHDFIHVYSPRQGQTAPKGQSFDVHISCKFQKKSLWRPTLYIFFHDLIHVYSPGAWTDSSQGTKFWCQRKGLITLPICCKFQRNLFDVWFYTFLYDLIHVFSPGAWADSSLGTKFWCQQKGLITYPFVASFKGISLKSDFIQLFSWFNKCI